ncbi:hypothetical protein [Actinomadura macrotermitis]|uniref:Uncharacterized protein n=1 Tax=Actinomadura macrotermitis TaxID=2585200 RepID=A0A7K0C6K5_9ACTN|nr:hypothetical protein [Actinomadura macrotermitis]MQY09065.1 hypothetical protein [Actinomadura macrotermitis]
MLTDTRSRAALAVLLVVAAATGTWRWAAQPRHAATPPAGAAPEATVLAYYQAVKVRDLDAAVRLWAPGFSPEEELTRLPDSPFVNWIEVRDVKAARDTYRGFCAELPRPCVSVVATYTMRQRHLYTGEDGKLAARFALVPHEGRWLIRDEVPEGAP